MFLTPTLKENNLILTPIKENNFTPKIKNNDSNRSISIKCAVEIDINET